MATAPSEHLQLEPPAPARISVRGAGGSSPRGDLHFKPAGEPSREPAVSILSHKAFLLISACFSKYCAWCERNVLPGGQPRANAPRCREGGGAGCCLQSENSQRWIPCLWLKIGAAGSGRQAGAQGHLCSRGEGAGGCLHPSILGSLPCRSVLSPLPDSLHPQLLAFVAFCA